ncbi:MAG: ribonuclease Z [Bacillota bacterium]|uniref:Ribonuclease Z n=1 Tax=Virgibacillus salarius TaxID=447199 RepID=A0A941I9F4_9BACI|nr:MULTISPECIES: ribonuclease Z [Bacillaceae]NAZ09424.1 ribonuclease Z [Agaribacter marinus]MBR7796714.1 ribonuclease Z [Virgibacillus salarius]MCC2249153.1 ribonuclease Z [Virgibacillus sp. AGTR]MDY7043455.1 ribonuclease Z [Virgibacillus sp. M23]QRZ16941.1 ribonuclease Z [Virgibacillus sp. AGTR]
MELIFLGTGAGVPSKQRNVSSVALSMLQELNSVWLFDCGEATQHQILHTSIKPRKINKIFITHLHGDHIFGLPGFLSSRSFQGGEDPLTIYGPKGIQQFVETSLGVSDTHLNYSLLFVEIENNMVVKDSHFSVHIQALDHAIPSFGFRIMEQDKPGELLVNKLKDIGIKPGPIYKQIKENEVVVTEAGRKIYRKDVIGQDKKGRVVAILGDTRYSTNYISLVKDADVLVHEATFSHDKSILAKRYFHSTTTQAAELAKKGNCKRLILTHISSRYQKEENEQLLQEAQMIFPHTEIAYDFSSFLIN